MKTKVVFSLKTIIEILCLLKIFTDLWLDPYEWETIRNNNITMVNGDADSYKPVSYRKNVKLI